MISAGRTGARGRAAPAQAGAGGAGTFLGEAGGAGLARWVAAARRGARQRATVWRGATAVAWAATPSVRERFAAGDDIRVASPALDGVASPALD